MHSGEQLKEYYNNKKSKEYLEGYKDGYEEGYKNGLETAEKVYPVSVADADLLHTYNKISAKEYEDFLRAKAEIIRIVSEKYTKIQKEKKKVL